MKHLLLLWVFIVTWNEYHLEPHYDWIPYNEDQGFSIVYFPKGELEFYTVELTTKTIKLATQTDVDLFVGTITIGGFKPYPTGIISKDAFNIQVKKEK